MAQGQERRSTYFIKKWFQIRFILKFVLLLIIGLAISATLLYFMSNQTITDTMKYGHLKSQLKCTYDLLLPSLIKTTLFSVLIVSLLGILLFAKTSHRLAGPLYRFEKGTERISQGDLTEKFKLRSYDEMTVLAEKFSQMTIALNQQIATIKSKTAELSALAQKLETKLDESGSPEAKKLSGELNKVVGEIKNTVDFFKV